MSSSWKQKKYSWRITYSNQTSLNWDVNSKRIFHCVTAHSDFRWLAFHSFSLISSAPWRLAPLFFRSRTGKVFIFLNLMWSLHEHHVEGKRYLDDVFCSLWKSLLAKWKKRWRTCGHASIIIRIRGTMPTTACRSIYPSPTAGTTGNTARHAPKPTASFRCILSRLVLPTKSIASINAAKRAACKSTAMCNTIAYTVRDRGTKYIPLIVFNPSTSTNFPTVKWREGRIQRKLWSGFEHRHSPF